MKTSLTLGLAVFLLGACAISEPVSHTGTDNSWSTASSTFGTGSGSVRPPDGSYVDRPEEDRELADVSEPAWPELPAADVARIARWMTEDELFALLGEPTEKITEVIDYDSGEMDWNTTIYRWKFQDSRITPVPMARDLDVRMALAPRNRPFPTRPEITGPSWVVVSWVLF